jgi:hypothetical protein
MSPLSLAATVPVETWVGGGLLITALLAALAAFVLVVAAVFSILFSRLDVAMKLVWIVLVFLAPVIGALLWFLIGRSRTPAPGYGYR